jgi:hypothetical protein
MMNIDLKTPRSDLSPISIEKKHLREEEKNVMPYNIHDNKTNAVFK